ncbi:hypothetical protein [Galactobacter sp.]|uniref:hypothetical protein n=1 Tax=Galactobacter sp. TaxID=2676125 RepID=UPI0025C08012|nr:hypothetical protein [Galactobacter sp.]
MTGNKTTNARRRVPGPRSVRLGAAAVAAAAALVLTACSGSESDPEPTPSGSGQQAVNEGAGIPTKAFTVAQSKQKVLTAQEFPGGVQGYREKRVGAQRLNLGRILTEVSGVPSECSTAIRSTTKQRVSVLSGAEASATVPKDASGTSKVGTVKVTIFTTRADAKAAQGLGLVSDTCSGTVAEPDSISPAQRGLSGVSVVTGSKQLTVAAGDWGANHVLVETTDVDAEVAQQIADAQLAKLAAPQD